MGAPCGQVCGELSGYYLRVSLQVCGCCWSTGSIVGEKQWIWNRGEQGQAPSRRAPLRISVTMSAYNNFQRLMTVVSPCLLNLTQIPLRQLNSQSQKRIWGSFQLNQVNTVQTSTVRFLLLVVWTRSFRHLWSHKRQYKSLRTLSPQIQKPIDQRDNESIRQMSVITVPSRHWALAWQAGEEFEPGTCNVSRSRSRSNCVQRKPSIVQSAS